MRPEKVRHHWVKIFHVLSILTKEDIEVIHKVKKTAQALPLTGKAIESW